VPEMPLSAGRLRFLAASAACLLLIGSPFPAPAARIPVVASIVPLGDLVRQVGGDRVQVRVLLPPGASPHTFEATPDAVREFAGARLFFQVGAGLESWAAALVQAAGGVRTVTLSEGMDLIRLAGGHEPPGDARTREPGNPHLWLDPLLALRMTGAIERALGEADPAGASVYRANAEAYGRSLRELDAEIRRTVSGFRVRSFVSFHPAWDYFARRYGLVQAGVIEESPGRDPTPRQLAAIVAAIRAAGIRAVFAEPQLNPKPAEVIAREAGVRVVILDPQGGLPGRETYLDLMRWNLARMREAME
jgi:zinc transport system substrate-binding protein